MVGAMLWNEYAVLVLFFFINCIGLFEFYQLQKNNFDRLNPVMVIFPGTFYYFSFILLFLFPKQIYILVPFIIILMPIVLFLYDLFTLNFRFSNSFVGIVASFYITVPFTFINFFTLAVSYNKDYNSELILGFFILLWTNDTFAYLTGKFLGKHKLWEKISPNKTWEGFFGGVFFTAIIGFIISLFFISFFTTIDWIIISIIISLFGTLGDLTESMLKRQAGVKDSGNFMPGHGGILDRFDGVLFAVPAVLGYFYLKTYLEML